MSVKKTLEAMRATLEKSVSFGETRRIKDFYEVLNTSELFRDDVIERLSALEKQASIRKKGKSHKEKIKITKYISAEKIKYRNEVGIEKAIGNKEARIMEEVLSGKY